MGVDYLTALSFKSRWDTAADTAALATIQAAEAYVSANPKASTATVQTVSQAQGTKSFAANAAASESSESVTPQVNLSISGSVYTATVTYSGNVATHFGGLVGISKLSVAGAATATSATSVSSPNVDFYLLLDNSPSMALPSSSSGVTALSALTTDSCAFACHEANSASSTIASNPVVNGQHIDNYQVARNNNITLRIDAVNSAVTNIMATAYDYAKSQPGSTPTYRFAVDAMDSTYAAGFTNVMSLTSNYISGWQSASSNFQLMEMYDENMNCASTTSHGVTNPCGAGTMLPNNLSDADTSYDDALSKVNAQMPTPGQGTGATGDSPQEVLFFVTDGVEDENSSGARLVQLINANGAHNYCTDIKARGIKIAVLYTTYYPLPPTDPFYVSYVEPFQPNIPSALQACASPGLFYQAGVDDDLSADFASLFITTMSQTAARLTQ
jgi:hypothetical protein